MNGSGKLGGVSRFIATFLLVLLSSFTTAWATCSENCAAANYACAKPCDSTNTVCQIGASEQQKVQCRAQHAQCTSQCSSAHARCEAGCPKASAENFLELRTAPLWGGK